MDPVEDRDPMQDFYRKHQARNEPGDGRTAVGRLMVAVWCIGLVFAVIGARVTDCGYSGPVPDCGDMRRGYFFMLMAASPLLLAGLVLIGSGARRSGGPWMGALARTLCLLLGLFFLTVALGFIPNREPGSTFVVAISIAICVAAGWTAYRLK